MRRTLTAKEAAEYLGISYGKLLDLCRRRLIPNRRVDRRYLFTRDSLDAWLLQLDPGLGKAL